MAAPKAKGPQKTISPLVVRYPRRMKPQKAYSVQVRWKSKEKVKNAGPYTVRLIMAGAQVIPSEQTMDPTKPTEKATFYVTPLVRKGWLKGERLEVLADGEKVQEIGLPAKVASQRRTWFLLLLTFLVPWFLINYVQMTESEYDQSVKKADPWTQMVSSLNQNTPFLTPEVKEGLNTAVTSIGLNEYSFKGSYNWLYRLFTLDEVFTEETIYAAHLPFWIGLFLFVLTVLSWFCHREKYKRKTGQPLPLVFASEDD